MKILIVLGVVMALACASHAEAPTHFHCDTPDDWLHTHSLFPGNLWPNQTVVYQLDETLTSQDIAEIQKAFYDIQNKTCIRFRPRRPDEAGYVSIEHDDGTCGVAHLCYTGTYQFAKFGGTCNFANVMIHELGHTLCLGHEQTRIDRDSYVHFDPCEPNDTPGRDTYETRGHLYDYTSQMHYQCGWCPGGWPRMEGVPGCGMDVQQGMSVLDSDKINDFYGCQGCLRHRWRRAENLTEADKDALISFGETSEGRPLYLCRAYVSGGEVSPGKYRLDENKCYASSNGVVEVLTDHVQVFVDPQRNSSDVAAYQPISGSRDEEDFTPVGRTPRGVSIYAAVATLESNGTRETAIGKVYGNNMTHAYIPFLNQEVVVTQFQIVGCE